MYHSGKVQLSDYIFVTECLMLSFRPSLKLSVLVSEIKSHWEKINL